MQWRGIIEDALVPLNLTHPQFVVLATTGWLTKDNAKVSQVDIGKAAGLDPNTTSQILRGLEAKKLIKRLQTVDERSKSPMLTESGNQKLAKALPAVEQADTLYFDELTMNERAEFMKIFQKLIRKE